MKRKVYVDLDECLINSQYKDRRTIINEEFEYWVWSLGDFDNVNYYGSVEEIITYLRPYAMDFLTELRNIFGAENVFMLTTSTENYALQINQHFGMGFTPLQIYTREYFTGLNRTQKKKEETTPILIDNQYRYEKNARRKIIFLGGEVDYYRVEEFIVWDGLGEEYSEHEGVFKSILEKIK